jgi:type IV pilus assembly protein PilM
VALFGGQKEVVGLDIGSHAIKLVELKHRGKAKELTSFGVQVLQPDAIVEGAIIDAMAVADAISTLVNTQNVKKKLVATSISGSAVIVKKITLPRVASPEELHESVRWEAEQYIPFPIEEVNLDYTILGKATKGEAIDVLLVAAKKDIVGFYSNAITQAGMKPVLMDIDAFAIQNAFEANYKDVVESNEVVALLNFGASKININIIKGENSLFTRDIAIGGNAITEAIMRDFNLSREGAESVKRGVPAEGVNPNMIQNSVDQILEEISKDVKRTFEFFRATAAEEEMQRIYICGGAARTPGIKDFLSGKFSIHVDVMNPFRNIKNKLVDTEFLNEYGPAAAVAVGLAIRKVGEA